MISLKEVKQAWANGYAVQFRNDGSSDWVEWLHECRLNLDYADEWRVKPKSRLVTQYEYRVFKGGVISTCSFSSFQEAEDSLSYMLDEGAVLIGAVGTHSYEADDD